MLRGKLAAAALPSTTKMFCPSYTTLNPTADGSAFWPLGTTAILFSEHLLVKNHILNDYFAPRSGEENGKYSLITTIKQLCIIQGSLYYKRG